MQQLNVVKGLTHLQKNVNTRRVINLHIIRITEISSSLSIALQ